MSYPEEPQPPTYRETDAGLPGVAPVSGPVPGPGWSGPASSGGWSPPPAGWSQPAPAGWTQPAPAGWSQPAPAGPSDDAGPQDDLSWRLPGSDPVTVRPAHPGAYFADRTPPHAQAPVRLRPAFPPPAPPPPPYPMMPRTLPIPPGPPPAPGNAVVPYAPQYPYPSYGYTVYPSGYGPPVPAQNSGLSVASMVLGILGVVFLCCDFGILSLAAVILGHLGLGQTRDGARAGRGFAIAGLALGYTVLVPAFAISVVVVLGNAFGGGHA